MSKQDYISLQPNKMMDLFGTINMTPKETSENKTINYVKKIISTKDMRDLKINWPKYLNAFYNNHLQFDDDVSKHINKSILSILTKHEITDDDLVKSSSDSEEINKFSGIEIDTTVDHLKRFMNVNALIDILNELNSSHDQIINYKDYTQKICQDYYLKQITKEKNDSLIKHWFFGIFCRIDLDLFDGKYRVPYHRGIDVLKKYLEHQTERYDNNDKRNKLIHKFINIYSKWTVEYLTEKFNQNKMSLVDVFNKLNMVNKVNELFIELSDRGTYLNNTIIGLVQIWDKYLETILNTDQIIDDKIIAFYNSVNLSNSNFNNITLKFCELWQNDIKQQIKPSRYGCPQLFNSLRKVCPLISAFRSGHNKSEVIVKYFADIYTFESNLIGYIMAGFANLMNNVYQTFYENFTIDSTKFTNINISAEINHSLVLISLYDNKDTMWSLYFKNVSSRIRNQNSNYRLNHKIIDFETSVYEYLVSMSGSSCDKTKTFLSNIKNSIDHTNMIRKCKIKYIDNNGEKKQNSKYWSEPDLSKVDYAVVDKHIWELENEETKPIIQLIDSDKYPTDIQTYLAVGKTYYEAVSETRNIVWDVENSVINYNIGDTNIISTIVQYTLISQIANKHMTKTDLINSVYNTKLDETNKINANKYLESIIDNMCTDRFKVFDILHDGTLCLSDKLSQKNKKNSKKRTIKLNKFEPHLDNNTNKNNTVNTQSVDSETNSDSANNSNGASEKSNEKSNEKTNEVSVDPSELVKMTPECINYLRLILLFKMFKSHSTKVYSIDTINQALNRYIDKYIGSNKFNNGLINVLKNLSNIPQESMIRTLKDLEKRDIIEETTKDSIKGYIYVV